MSCGSVMRCRLCAGAGRIVLLAALMADMRVRSSFRTETCHFCRGAGESTRMMDRMGRRTGAAAGSAARGGGDPTPDPARERRLALVCVLQPRDQLVARGAVDDPFAHIGQLPRLPDPGQQCAGALCNVRTELTLGLA